MTAARRDAPQPRQAPREMKHSKKTQRPLPPHHLTKEVEVGEKKDRRMTPIGRRRTGDRKTTARRIRKTGRVDKGEGGTEREQTGAKGKAERK